MTIIDINKILSSLADNPSRENILDFSFSLLQWMNIEPNAANKPQLLSPQTQKLKDFLATVPQTVQPQLYRLSAENQNIRVRFAVLKKLKKEYISQLVDNDPGLTSFQASIKGIINIPGREQYVPAQPYFIHFVTTPDYDKLVLIFNQGEQKRIVTFRNRLTNTQYNKIIQLWQSIGTKSKPEIADLLWKSLDIKEVNKEFYKQIKERFDALLGIVKTQYASITLSTGVTATDNQVKQFTVRLIGRYIFCWFLKEKGIIPHSLISKVTIEKTENYYQNVLLKLFFETLNTKVQDRNPQKLDKLFEKIPYLNGGLFDESEEDKLFTKLKLDAWLMPFVEILESYDFTVDESSSQYQQVAVDPEMLGRIFENLLASQNEETEKLANQRKAFGAFYTPREIVDYMVNESIKAYLQTQWEQHIEVEKTNQINNPEPIGDIFGYKKPQQLSIEIKRYQLKPEDKQKIEKALEPLFANNPDAVHLKKDDKTLLLGFLEQIKILDPACGSGAFPMGILHKLVELNEVLGTVKSSYELKKDILSQNIYGVDIMPMAIEIARLRAWLSLVLEEDYKPNDPKHNFGVKPLPNLDFKFVCANSLIDLGLDAYLQEANNSLYGGFAGALIKKLQELQSIRKEYFMPELTSVDKEKVKHQFLETRAKIISDILGEEDDNRSGVSEAGAFQDEKLKQIALKIKQWNPFNDSHPSSFFSPAWMFGIREGFDVVIGNPPYVDIKSLPPEIVREFFKTFKTTQKRINLYAVFIEKGYSLLSKDGNIIFIIPNSILVNESYQLLRKHLIQNLKQVIKLPDNVFEAIVETIILQAEKGNNEKTIKTRYFDNGENVNFNNLEYINFTREDWEKDKDVRFNIFSDDNTEFVLRKIESTGKILKDIADFSLGITPYDKYKGHSKEDIENRIFHSEKKLNNKYVPLISGKNIHKFIVENSPIDEFLKYGNWLGAPREIKFFKEPRVIVRQIVAGKPDFKIYAGYTEEELYFTQIGFGVISRKKNTSETKFILALLNSELIKFYHANRFLDKEKEIFQKILIANTKQFPIPKNPLSKSEEQIEKLVDEILKRKENKQDTTALEREIDLLVYKLYELTYDEVKIIDKDFWLSEEEYEKIKVE
ncbi:MAG: N-6 DNA methylase [Bacteroidales bacterium]|nr:N-6 DNA methylase [Bacteroidales bacterium]